MRRSRGSARGMSRRWRALFTDVLALCAKAGLVSVGLVAVDGTLIAANASAAATRTHEAIREEMERILGEAAGSTPPRTSGSARRAVMSYPPN